jgi:predicted phage-related endonuclease
MITEQQKEARKRFVGSSDISALVGADEFRNASDVWLEKTGRLDEDKNSEAADSGNDLEDAIIRMCQRRIGRPIVTGDKLPTLYDANGIFCANLDGAVLRKDCPDVPLARRHKDGNIEAVVEAKSTGYRSRWGDSIDDVPLNVICQANWQMSLADCELAWIPVFFPGYKRVVHPEVYRANRSDSLILEMREVAERFWEYVVTDTPPPLDFSELAHVETLERRHRIQGEIVSLNSTVEEAWLGMAKAKERISFLESDVEQYRRIILSALGDNEAGRLSDGSLVTYFEQGGGKRADLGMLEMELADLVQLVGSSMNDNKDFEVKARLEGLFEKVVRQPRFRVLRHKKSKIKAKGI